MTTSTTVTQYYNNVLQRAPSASELSSWTALIDSGALTEAQVLDAIVNSTEAQTYAAQVVRIYQAAFGRVPDTTGIDGWVDDLRDGTSTTTDLASGFVNSTEWATRYGSTEVNTATLTGLYQNVLGRIPSGAEVDAWIATGLTLDQILIGFANSAEFQANISAAVNTLLTTAGNTATADIATVFDGASSLDSSGGGGTSLVLTEAIDNLTGTTGADTITGVVDGTPANSTLEAGDAVDGLGGTDVFNAIIAANFVGGASISNVEQFFVRSAGNFSFAADDINGIEQFWTNGSSGQLTVTGLESLSTTLGVRGTDDLLTATFDTTQTTGTSDTATIALDGAVGATGEGVEITGNVIEALNISLLNNASNVADDAVEIQAGTGNETVSITGSVAADLLFEDVNIETVDASTTTAGVGIDVVASADEDITVTGGSGDDIIRVGAITDDDIIDGGDGTDQLRIDVETTVTSPLSVTNVETLRIDDAGASAAINLDNLGITTVRRSEGGQSDITTLNNLSTDAVNFIFRGTNEATGNMEWDGFTVEFDVTGTNDVSSANVVVDNGGTSTTGSYILGDLTINDLDALTITATEAGTGTGDSFDAGNIDGDSLVNLTVSSNTDLDIQVSAGTLETIDLSGSDAGITLDLDGIAANGSVTLGDGNDTADVQGTGTTAFTLNLGSGTDTVLLSGAATNAGVIIDGFSTGNGGDIIDFNTNAAFDGDDTTTLTTFQSFGTFANWATNTAANADDENDIGFAAIGTNIGAATAGGLETAVGGALIVADTGNLGAANANDVAYIAIDDGSDTYIFHVAFAATDGTFTAGDDAATLIATLNDVSDATTLNTSNLLDFI